DGEGQLPLSQSFQCLFTQQKLSALLSEGLNALAVCQLFQRFFINGDNLNSPPQQHFSDGTTRNAQTQDGDKRRQFHRSHHLPKKFDNLMGQIEQACQN
ncbi:MAG: hypothetical protein BKPUNTRY_002621, partial [Candidatus Fervidibacter sp.]